MTPSTRSTVSVSVSEIPLITDIVPHTVRYAPNRMPMASSVGPG